MLEILVVVSLIAIATLRGKGKQNKLEEETKKIDNKQTIKCVEDDYLTDKELEEVFENEEKIDLIRCLYFLGYDDLHKTIEDLLVLVVGYPRYIAEYIYEVPRDEALEILEFLANDSKEYKFDARLVMDFISGGF